MNFWRAILASLLSLVCTLAVSVFVTLQTVNTTLLDRGEVKTWVANSGAYDRLLSTVLDSNPNIDQQLTSLGNDVTQEAAKSALLQTFSPGFVQQSTERVLDGTYNWLDSKQPNIQFEINTTAYRETFIKNLAAELEPQLTVMPRCTSLAQFNSASPTCLPPGTDVATAAELIAIDAANRAPIFSRPITTNNFSQFISTTGESAAATPANPSPEIPRGIASMRMWLMWLPVIALLSGILMVLLSQRRLKAGKHLAGRLTFSLAITCALGLIVAYFGQTVTLSDFMSSSSSVALVNSIGEPIMHQAAPAIGNRLALVSGIAGMVTLVLWVILGTIYKKRERAALLEAPMEVPVAPKPPTDDPTAPSKTSNP